MNISRRDREVLQELAEKIANIATLPIHNEKIKMWKKLNSLKSKKPMIWINPMIGHMPWHEMEVEDELKLNTKNEFCRKIEMKMLKTIYQWKNMRVDMVVEPKIACPLVINNSGFSIEEKVDIARVDSDSDIYSRHFHIQIKDEDDIQKIKMPKVSYDKDATEQNYQIMSEIFDGILEVEKCGTPDYWFVPWDRLIRWLGVQEGLTALVLRPKFIHKCMERLTQAYISMLDQYEKLNLLTLNNGNCRAGTGGLAYTNGLPQSDFNPKKVKAADLWGFCTAQIFTEVSPQMHEEFALNYELHWLKRFGLNYYGCYEALHKKLTLLRKFQISEKYL